MDNRPIYLRVLCARYITSVGNPRRFHAMVACNRHGMTLWEGYGCTQPAWNYAVGGCVRCARKKRHHLAYASIDRRTTINSMSLCPMRALCEIHNICWHATEIPRYGCTQPAWNDAVGGCVRCARKKRHHRAYASIDRRTTINKMPLCPLRALCESECVRAPWNDAHTTRAP